MNAERLPVAAVAAVLAEVVRGRSADAAVFDALRQYRIEVSPVEMRVGVRAGRLLGLLEAGSEMAIDAFTVATADLAGGATIATVDVRDIRLLASFASNVAVADIR